MLLVQKNLQTRSKTNGKAVLKIFDSSIMLKITWSSSKRRIFFMSKMVKWKNIKCDKYPKVCKVTKINGKTIFKYKASDKGRDEDDCVWGIYVSYEGKSYH